ncbi:MAG: sugar phosphate isomerase/epimerase [Acidobacteria bacterium]|nr:sugar phosphate isomerase/epimerase [Spirochaetota bacterium]MBE3130248.1 sugar phosphate isomerase/epimerase [Acidobacteriota bacterium]
MKLGIAVAPPEALPSAFVVFRDDLEVSLRKASALGYDGIELALLHPGQIDPGRIEALLGECGLELPMISSGQVFAEGGLCFTSPDREIRDRAVARVKGLVDAAGRFHSMVNIGRVRGPLEPGRPRGISEERFLEALGETADYAGDRGVVIALEPVNRYELNFINRLDEAVEMIEKLGRPNVKVMPDLFHMNIEEAGIESSFLACGDHIGYVHFADSNRLAPGFGHLNFSIIIAVLNAIGYKGYVTAEILPVPDPYTAAASAAKYVRTLLPGKPDLCPVMKAERT